MDFEENINKFTVNTVATDGLAPLGARTSAGTVMTKSVSHTYIHTYINSIEICGWTLNIRPYKLYISKMVKSVYCTYINSIEIYGYTLNIRTYQLYISKMVSELTYCDN